MRLCSILLAIVACGGEGKQLSRERVVEPGTALFNGYTHGNVRCYECHDGDGGGTKWGPALAPRVLARSDAELRRAIADGVGKMPAFRGKLTAAEIDTLVGWLRGRFDHRAPAGNVVVDPCELDDDCLVTNFPGCCACPQCAVGPPTARSREGQRRAEAVCAVASCSASHCDVAGMCPPGEPADHFIARCREHRCTAERR